MQIRQALLSVAAIVTLGLLAAGCGGGISSEDRIATQVAEQRSVAATLTADAQVTPAGQAAATETPTPPPASTETPTVAPASSATPTSTPATANSDTPTPTPAPVDTVTPTPTPIVAVPLPIPGATNLVNSTDPNYDGINVLLPGFAVDEVTDPMIFRGRIGMALSIFSVTSNTQEPGDGVRLVTFEVVDLEDYETVYTREETASLYCLFGGNTLAECLPYEFAANDFRWPNGNPIYDGEYQINILIETDDDSGQWNPTVEIRGALPRPGAETTGFSGSWQTNLGVVELQQSGDRVVGTYRLYGDSNQYQLEGTVSSGVLDGTYTGFDGGTIRFELGRDGSSFDGNWFYRGGGAPNQWCGVRSGPLPAGCGFSGSWESIGDYSPDYPPTMELTQNGNQVQGTFLNGLRQDAGTLDGRVGTEGTGSQLTAVGRWSIGGASGDFRWRMVGGQSAQFRGRSVTADGQPHQWCGWRTGVPRPNPCLE